MANGIVVDHKESGVRYAISERNFNHKVHTKIRDLKPGETVLGFKPLRKGALGEGGQGVEDYSGKEWTVEALLAEIDSRNEQLEDQYQIFPGSGRKADLITALMLYDEESLAESEAEDDSDQE